MDIFPKFNKRGAELTAGWIFLRYLEILEFNSKDGGFQNFHHFRFFYKKNHRKKSQNTVYFVILTQIQANTLEYYKFSLRYFYFLT